MGDSQFGAELFLKIAHQYCHDSSSTRLFPRHNSATSISGWGRHFPARAPTIWFRSAYCAPSPSLTFPGGRVHLTRDARNPLLLFAKGRSQGHRPAKSSVGNDVPSLERPSAAFGLQANGAQAPGSMSARPLSGSWRLRRCAGLSVRMISRVGRTFPSIRCPASAAPSRRPSTQ